MVVAGTMAVLTEDVHAGFTVVRHQRSVQSRVVIKAELPPIEEIVCVSSPELRNGSLVMILMNSRNGRRAE